MLQAPVGPATIDIFEGLAVGVGGTVASCYEKNLVPKRLELTTRSDRLLATFYASPKADVVMLHTLIVDREQCEAQHFLFVSCFDRLHGLLVTDISTFFLHGD